MATKCNKCGNNVFDSRAYLKISKIERLQQDKIDSLNEELKLTKGKCGKQSEEVIDLQKMLNIENRILKKIIECKNVL